MSGYPIGPEPEEIVMREAETMTERNAAKDLAVCEAATPEPWWAEPADNLKDGAKAWFICFKDLGKEANAQEVIISVVRRDRVAFDNVKGRLLATGMIVPVNPKTEQEDEANAIFFAMSRSALPYWIREAQKERAAREKAEQALEALAKAHCAAGCGRCVLENCAGPHRAIELLGKWAKVQAQEVRDVHT